MLRSQFLDIPGTMHILGQAPHVAIPDIAVFVFLACLAPLILIGIAAIANVVSDVYRRTGSGKLLPLVVEVLSSLTLIAMFFSRFGVPPWMQLLLASVSCSVLATRPLHWISRRPKLARRLFFGAIICMLLLVIPGLLLFPLPKFVSLFFSNLFRPPAVRQFLMALLYVAWLGCLIPAVMMWERRLGARFLNDCLKLGGRRSRFSKNRREQLTDGVEPSKAAVPRARPLIVEKSSPNSPLVAPVSDSAVTKRYSRLALLLLVSYFVLLPALVILHSVFPLKSTLEVLTMTGCFVLAYSLPAWMAAVLLLDFKAKVFRIHTVLALLAIMLWGILLVVLAQGMNHMP